MRNTINKTKWSWPNNRFKNLSRRMYLRKNCYFSNSAFSSLGYPQRCWWGSYCQGWTQTSSWNRTDKDRHRHGGVRQRRQARDGGREKQNHCQESSPRHPQDNNGDTGEKISSYPGWGQESWAQQSQADIPPRTKSCGWGKLSTYFKYMKSISWWICSTTKICNLFGKSLSWRLNLKHWIFIYF